MRYALVPGCLSLLLLVGAASSVAAQQAPGSPAALPVGHRLAIRQYSPASILPPVPAAAASQATDAAPTPALIPTVRAAAAYAPRPVFPGQFPPTTAADGLPPAPRRDLTGVAAAPPYDIYQNLPEEFRKHTLRAPWTEPLLLQVLRGALGR